MTVSKVRARRLAKRILRKNKKGRSYRVMAREDYPGVKAGTLNRFANGKGSYIPADEQILIALGLKKPRKPRRSLPKWFKETEEAQQWFDGKRQAVKEMAAETRDTLKKAKVNRG